VLKFETSKNNFIFPILQFVFCQSYIPWPTAALHQYLEYLHQCSVCDPDLQLLDEIHRVQIQCIHWRNILGPRKNYMHSFHSPGGALEQSNKHKSNHIYWQLPVCDFLDNLIAPGGLLLLVSHLFAVPSFNLSAGWKHK